MHYSSNLYTSYTMDVPSSPNRNHVLVTGVKKTSATLVRLPLTSTDYFWQATTDGKIKTGGANPPFSEIDQQ